MGHILLVEYILKKELIWATYYLCFFLYFVFSQTEFAVTEICDDNVGGHFQLAMFVLVMILEERQNS